VTGDGRIGTGSVERGADREHIWIRGRLLEESLGTRVEALVGVVHEEVAFSDDLEEICSSVVGARGGCDSLRDDRLPGRTAQFKLRQPCNLARNGEIQDAVNI